MSLLDDNSKTKSRTQPTPQLINDILTDKYHNGLTIAKIRESRGVSYALIKSIDEKYSAQFKERFGVKATPNKSITIDDMTAYWDSTTPAPTSLSKPAPQKKR
jgi:hypothetical protein